MIIWIHTLDQGLYLSYRALGLRIQVETVAHLQLHNQINVNSRTRTDQCNDGFCWSARRDKLNTVATRASVCFILMSKHRPFLLLQIAKSIGVGTLLLIIHNKAVCDNLVSHADSWTSDVGEPLCWDLGSRLIFEFRALGPCIYIATVKSVKWCERELLCLS